MYLAVYRYLKKSQETLVLHGYVREQSKSAAALPIEGGTRVIQG